MKGLFSLVSLLSLAAVNSVVAQSPSNSWAGANSFFLHTMQPDARNDVLDKMQAANLKVVRVFINEMFANEKNSGNRAVNDLETREVGQYDDGVLNMMDELMVETHRRGMKLNIVLHDRYSLGCFKTDAYVAKYNIPRASQCPQGNDIRSFYTNGDAGADMDRRFAHILAHRNPNFDSRPWAELSEAIWGFDIQNESQAHSGEASNRNWVCERATVLRGSLPSRDILIVTGGGAEFSDSTFDEHFRCPAIDVVAVHSYFNDFRQNLPGVIQKAADTGKRVIVQEFGAANNKAASLNQQMTDINDLKVPWIMWQIVNPNNPTDFETFTQDEQAFGAITDRARDALGVQGVSQWPEVHGGNNLRAPELADASTEPVDAPKRTRSFRRNRSQGRLI
ncbi:hypothetical protein HDU85_004075 [Gaertneriomyces sp. JEL0708]|nr:hypothetical protein HDU85_004075 [Gaertneriomyces sp. JEL0708]